MSFPNDNQFVPVMLDGAPVTDPARDVSPDETDIVGNSSFPAAYYAYDGTNVYFRMRLNADPRFRNGFHNFAWGVLFDTDGVASTYEWSLTVNGLDNTLELVRNTVTIPNSFNDQAEGIDGRGTPSFSVPIINFGVARAKQVEDGSVFGGTDDYFIEFFVPAATLFSLLDITADSSLRFLFFTATNANNFNKDFIDLKGSLLSAAFSDPLTISGGDVRAKLTVAQTVVAEPTSVIAGQSVTIRGSIAVANTGRSDASQAFVTPVFSFDKPISFSVGSVTIGMTNYSVTSQTLTWNIGNLTAGGTAVLDYVAVGVFNLPGQRVFDNKSATGVDSFTGESISSPSNSVSVDVIANGGISGTIIDKMTGLPLIGTSVQAFTLPGLTPAGSTISGAGGAYAFSGLPAGTYQLQYAFPDYQTQSLGVTVTANAITVQNVLLEPLPASVQGVITDAQTGTGIAGAIVNLTNKNGVHIAQVTADANGSYTIPSITPGYYRISLSAAGFQLVDLPLTLMAGEAQVRNAALQPNPGSVAGTITNAGGLPLAGVFVEALDNRNNVLSTTITSASGQYAINSLAPSTNDRLRISSPGFVTLIIGFQVTAGQTTTVNATLSDTAGSIAGTITDAASGLPIDAVSIRVFISEGIALQSTLSDAGGNYAIPSLSPGSYSVVIAAEGYASRTVGAYVNSGVVTPNSVSLEMLAGAITGTVTDLPGTPLPDVVIRVFQNNIIVGRVATDGTGSYMLGNLASGNYVVSARAEGFGGEQLGAFINPGGVTIVNFHLPPNPGFISGTIADESGAPIAGAIIAVQHNMGGGPIILTRVISGVDGRYHVNSLNPGSYLLNVSAAGFQNGFTGVRVARGQQIIQNFALPASPGSIIGSVTDASGAPIFAASIDIRVTNANGVTVYSLFSDPAGLFEADNLAPGTYTVFAGADNFRTATASVSVLAESAATVALILYPNPGSIQGQITDSVTGAGLAGAIVDVSDQNSFLIQAVLADGGGNYRIDGLIPGNYTLIAQNANYQSRAFGAIVLAGAISPVDFSLDPNPGVIVGQLLPAAAGSIIQLFNINNLLISTSAASEDGSFRFDNVQTGNYYLTAVARGYSSDIVGASLQPGQTVSLGLRLVANPGSLAGSVVDPAGNPIPAATIKVVNGNESVRGIGQAQADGSYAIDNLPNTILSVIASAPDFSNATLGAAIGPGEAINGLNFVLTPNPGTINGQITDSASGLPIGGADVEIRMLSSAGLVIASVTASPFGNFLVNGLEPGTYTVISRSAGYATDSVGAIVLSNRSTFANIALRPLFGGLSGLVVSRSGIPITNNGTLVKLYTIDGVLLETVFVDSSGSFAISGLEPGQYVLNVSAESFVTAVITVFATAGLTSSVTAVLLPQTSALRGTVTDAATGLGISGALIQVNDVFGLPAETGFSDENGNFLIRGIPPGSFTVSAAYTDYSVAVAGVITRPGQIAEASLQLTLNTGAITGFVSDFINGANIEGAVIRMYDAVTGALVTTIQSSIGGEYLFEGLAPGSYTSIVSAEGYVNEFGGFTIAPGAVTRFSYALDRLPGRIAGVVTSATDGMPLQGASIVVRQFNNFGPVLSTILSDVNGLYDTGEVAASNYAISAMLAGYVSRQTSAGVTPDGVTTVNVSLERITTKIDGTVTDGETGMPLPNVPVDVLDDNGVNSGSSVTDNQGQYTLPSAPSGEQSVVVSAPGRQTNVQFVIQPPGQSQVANVALSGNPVTIQGIIRNSDNLTPIPGAIVHILTPGDDLAIETLIADGFGFYLAGGLAPDSYTVTASSPNFGSAARFIQAEENGNIALSPFFGTLRGTIRDSGGQPLYEALAEVITADRRVIRQIISNEQGQYVFTNIAAGVVFARFSFPGKQTVILQTTVFNGQTTILDVVLADEDEE
ncbi:carboxypeptidase regulatory-like domain-containing protein [Paenibacillus harenae]|uniref:Surface anchored protein n=1 Tax=Paenibacillus harenae TaxID=306543 RepID=A0ABT9U5T9_PAEHA|nr:carboxypeptidase regulatory-like domain-containing protein [Paenibacillus harenae]MDQ0115006.1 putative surface anchored protein [Paenibacillus harenae]